MKRYAIAMMAVLFSMAAVAAEPLKICTGGEGGAYEGLGQGIGADFAQKTKLEYEVLNTGGSIENADKLSDGECQMAIMQADAVVSRGLPRDIVVTNAHVEAIYWIHGADGLSDFADITDDENKAKAVAIVDGSGAEVTLQNFGEVDKDYKNVKTVSFADWYDAAEAAFNGYTMKAGVRTQIAGLVYVGRPGFVLNKEVMSTFGKGLTVGEIDESNFKNAKDANGNQLYTSCEIKNEDITPLKADTILKPDTFCIRAQVVYNNEYHNKMDKAEARTVKRAVSRAVNGVLMAVRQ